MVQLEGQLYVLQMEGFIRAKVLYLILDGIRLGIRAGTQEKEAVLVAWAFLENGSRELLDGSLVIKNRTVRGRVF